MTRARHRCSLCEETGHNAQRCPQRLVPPVRETQSRSQRAARWLAVQPQGVFATAAETFGISRQAVAQAWARLFSDRDPPGFEDKVQVALERVGAGEAVAAAARAAGCTRGAVYKRLRRQKAPG